MSRTVRRQVKLFRKSVGSHHEITQCLSDCDRLHADPLTHTYADITAYVTRHLPNIRAAAHITSTTTGRVLTVSADPNQAPKAMAEMSMTELQCAYSVMAYKLENQQKKRQKGAGRKDKKQSDKRRKDAVGQHCPTTSARNIATHMAPRTHTPRHIR